MNYKSFRTSNVKPLYGPVKPVILVSLVDPSKSGTSNGSDALPAGDDTCSKSQLGVINI